MIAGRNTPSYIQQDPVTYVELATACRYHKHEVRHRMTSHTYARVYAHIPLSML